jgi:TRAP-type C4-dicarboxylate transport system substrate-binding protein
MQTFLAASTPVTQNFEKLAVELKEKSGGAIDIAVLPLNAAVAAGETIAAVQNGILDGHYTSPPYFASRDPGFSVLGDTLSAYPDPVMRDRWFTEGGGLALARQLYETYGLYFVGPVYWPPEWMPMRRPIEKVADFRGLKIRMPPGLAGDLMNRLGVAIVNIPFSEVVNALQTGVIDGADAASMDLNLDLGIHSGAKHSVFARHSMPTTEVSISLRRWRALTPANQELLVASVANFSAIQRGVFEQREKTAVERAHAMGVATTILSDEDQKAMRTLTDQVWTEWAKKSELTNKIIESHRAFMRTMGLV